jgi:hypothetical protein
MYSVQLLPAFKQEFEKAIRDLKQLVGTEITEQYINNFKAVTEWKIDNLAINPSGTKIERGRYKNLYSFEIKNFTFIFRRDNINKTIYLQNILFGSLLIR